MRAYREPSAFAWFSKRYVAALEAENAILRDALAAYVAGLDTTRPALDVWAAIAE